MKNKRIALDIDGVLLDTSKDYLKLFNETHKSNFVKEDITKFNFCEILGISEKEMVDLFEKIDFSKSELTHNEIIEVIAYLKLIEGYTIDLITNTSIYTLGSKCKRLVQLGVHFDSIIRTDNKLKFAKYYDFIVEDNPFNLEEIKLHGGRPICFDQPWNQEWKGERIYNFNDLRGMI